MERGTNREKERSEGNGVKHEEGSFEQAPGLSRGRGRAVPTTLPSVKQTDTERERMKKREREREMKVGGGWKRWRGSSDSAHRSNEHSLSLSPSLTSGAERTMRTHPLRAPQGLILGRLSPKCFVTKN